MRQVDDEIRTNEPQEAVTKRRTHPLIEQEQHGNNGDNIDQHAALEDEHVPIGHKAVAFYRAWDTVHPGIVDSDFAPQVNYEYMLGNEADALFAIEHLRQEFQQEYPDELDIFHPEYTLRAKLFATERVLVGRVYDFRQELGQVVQETMGIDLNDYTDRIRRRIPEQIKEVQRQLERMGYSVSYEEAARRFKEDHSIDPEMFRDRLEFHAQQGVGAMQEYLGKDYGVEVKPNLVSANNTWTASSTRRGEESILEVNANAPGYYEGDDESIASHEGVGHLLAFAMVHDALKHGKGNPGLAVTTLRDPRLYASEGLANTVHYAVPDVLPMSELGQFSFDRRFLRSLVYYDAHLRVNSIGYRRADVMRFIKSKYPFDSDEVIERELELREHSTENRAYNLVYPASEMDYREWFTRIRRIDPEGTRMRQFLEWHLSHILTPDQARAGYEYATRWQPPAPRAVIYSAGPPELYKPSGASFKLNFGRILPST